MELTTKIVIEVLTLPSITALGCVTAYIYSEQKEVKSSQSFLRRFFPERLDVFYFRLDFFMTAVIGTAIGLLLYEPRNPYQALAAGIGWTAAFAIFKTERRKTPTAVSRNLSTRKQRSEG